MNLPAQFPIAGTKADVRGAAEPFSGRLAFVQVALVGDTTMRSDARKSLGVVVVCVAGLALPAVARADDADDKRRAAEARAKELEAVRLLMLEKQRRMEAIKAMEKRLRAKGFRPPSRRSPTAPTPTSAPAWNAEPTLWKIPAGMIGVKLSDGTRIIGTPAQGWKVSLKTGFGVVAVPLAQVQRVVPAQADRVAVYLKNGDRVSGVLTSNTLRLVTAFGTLSIPTSELRVLSAVDMQLGQPAFRTRTPRLRIQTRGGAYPPPSGLPPGGLVPFDSP